MSLTRTSLTPIAVLLGFALLTSCAAKERAPVCIDRPFLPTAVITLSPPLAVEGKYTLEVEADGASERCTLTISSVGPAKPMGGVVAGPTTRTEMDCKSIEAEGISTEGGLASLSTIGTPAKLSIRMLQGDKEIAKQRFDLQYVPTELAGPGCNKTPRATGTLTIAR